MKLRSILASMLLAAAPFAGAQSVDYVFVRAAHVDSASVAKQDASTDTAERNLPSATGNAAKVTRELDAMLEQRFSVDASTHSAERLLVSAN